MNAQEYRSVRTQLSLALILGLTACATATPAAWQKSGADENAIARDAGECRASARQEAARQYPHGFSYPSFGASGNVLAQQRDDTHRNIAETSAFDACMRARGYVRAAREK